MIRRGLRQCYVWDIFRIVVITKAVEYYYALILVLENIFYCSLC